MKIGGVEVFVERLQGDGDLNFVLIHNAGGDHRFFIHQIETLKKYGDVILLDLPSHGKSSKVDITFSMNFLSQFIAQVCENLSLHKVCLIGLNNGADVAINCCLKQTSHIWGIILIDPIIFMDESFIREINDFCALIATGDAQHYRGFIKTLVESLLINTDVRTKQIAIEAFTTVSKSSLQQIFKGLIEWDKSSSGILKNIDCPVLCILTDEHHCSYAKLSQQAPHFEIGKVIGSRAWATLEVPEQVNSMIKRFIKITS